MEQLLKPEGDVVAEHRASLAWRIVSVVLFGIPAALWLVSAWSGPRENAAILSIPGAVLIALCALVIVQQGKVGVVLRTDGVERWGLRGALWTLRWEDATQLRYQPRASMPSASTCSCSSSCSPGSARASTSASST